MITIIEIGDLVEFDAPALPPADPRVLDNTPVNVKAVRRVIRGRVVDLRSGYAIVRSLNGIQYALRSYRKVLPPSHDVQ